MDSKRGWLAWTGPRARFGFRWIPLLALAATPLAHANEAQSCDEPTVSAVSDWAHAEGDLVSSFGTDTASACKPMPNAPDTTIAAMAFLLKGADPTDREPGTKLQVVALLRHGHVVAGAREKVEEDATFQIYDYTIDTARYILAPGVRAFGVRVASSTSGPKCADNNADGYLTLWIRDGKQLRAVMATNLSGRHSVVGVPACSDGDGVLEDADITVSVEKTTSHGFADLSLVATVNRSTYAGGKETKAPPRIVRDTLHYDGKTYGSDTFREFWYGDAP
jgi:hypothetical protein